MSCFPFFFNCSIGVIYTLLRQLSLVLELAVQFYEMFNFHTVAIGCVVLN